jgi:hypothetical protein
MVATIGHVSGDETIPIRMLADFGTTILSPVKIYCQKQKLREKAIKSQVFERILCESVDVLDKEFITFGENIIEHMNMGKHGTNGEGHKVSQLFI